jgi:hypothetical protein
MRYANFRLTEPEQFEYRWSTQGKGKNTGRVDPSKYDRSRDEDLGICFVTACTKDNCTPGDKCPWLHHLTPQQMRWLRLRPAGFKFLKTVFAMFANPKLSAPTQRITATGFPNSEPCSEKVYWGVCYPSVHFAFLLLTSSIDCASELAASCVPERSVRGRSGIRLSIRRMTIQTGQLWLQRRLTERQKWQPRWSIERFQWWQLRCQSPSQELIMAMFRLKLQKRYSCNFKVS